jgi:hypothetical protein
MRVYSQCFCWSLRGGCLASGRRKVQIVRPGSITLDEPLVHLGGGEIGRSNGSRGREATTSAAAGPRAAKPVPMAASPAPIV